MLRFYYIDSPPPLTVGLFFIHNHSDGTYSGIIETAEMMLMCNFRSSISSAHGHLIVGAATIFGRPFWLYLCADGHAPRQLFNCQESRCARIQVASPSPELTTQRKVAEAISRQQRTMPEP